MLPIVPLEGRVVGEPELKFGTSGKAMARFRVKAADRRKNEQTGKWEDTEVLWATVTTFGDLAEHVAESLVDGDQVLAIGKWSTAQWMDQAGTKRSAPRFVASAVGPGLQFAARPHSPETMAKHRGPRPVRPEEPAPHGFGHRFADAAVAAGGQGGDAPGEDPWA